MKRLDEGGGSRIKGACLIEALGWMQASAGRDRVEAALARMSEPARAKIDVGRKAFGLIASEWYPATNVHVVLDAMTAGRSREERQRMARSMAKAVMEGTLRGVYGVLFSMMATPERYAQHAPRLWSKYYDGGRVVFTLPGPRTMVAKVIDWKGHHPFLCDLVRFARVAALEAMGCANVFSECHCKCDVGGNECVTILTWS